ncbi:MAG: hypothetical protein ACFFAE_21560 [Candidatus Hodarchaeota archaeon]
MVTINAIIEAFLSNPPYSILLTILGWLYIFPIIFLLRSFRKTYSFDYLLMAGMFLFS